MAKVSLNRTWYIIAPGYGPYAVSFKANSEADCRAQYAAFLGRKRCPNGTAAWPA